MNKLLSRLQFLISPLAIGIYVTLAWSGVTLEYFVTSSLLTTDQRSSLHHFISLAHQKSIDFRLTQIRGPQKGSPQVGLLTVDEKAVTSVGRWPWPRETLAKAIDQAVKYGAKVVAFDMVFSEPSEHPLKEAFETAQFRFDLNPQLKSFFQEQIQTRDGDLLMYETLKQHKDHIILGSFPREYAFEKSGLTSICLDWSFGSSLSAQNWTDREASQMVILDSSPITLPSTLTELYKAHIQSLASDRLNSLKPENSSPIQAQKVRDQAEQDQLKYCDRWLDEKQDELFEPISESWGQIAEQTESESPGFAAQFPSFQDWVSYLKSNSLVSAIPPAQYWVMNAPEIYRDTEATYTGFFNAALDDDGSIRRTNLLVRTGNTYMPSIALKAFLKANNYMAQIHLHNNPRTLKKEISQFEILNDEGEHVFNLPTDGSGRLLINYAGPQKMYPYISLAELLDPSPTLTYEERVFDRERPQWIEKEVTAPKSEFLKDKIFILGATAMGIFDLRVTPFDENYPGAETHVNVVDNLLRRDFLRNHPNEEIGQIVGIFAIGIILSLGLAHLGAAQSLILTVMLFMGVVLIDAFFLFGQGIVVAIVFPLGLIVALFAILVSYKYVTEERGKKELRSTFQKYVSPSIVDEILKDPSNLELGGKKADVTVFFSDVRGFTTISEKLDPKALSDLLNAYLTPMTELVFANKGTLDKYMGDAIMAFFGAPVAYPNHPELACRCALQSTQKLFELQKQFAEQGLPEIDLGIGLNSGEVSVGNMGSETVRNYTVMGDTVNLASRLEGITKQYGVRIVLSEFTQSRLGPSFVTREIDRVRVKGKLKPVRIFELIAEGSLPEALKQSLDAFYEGYSLYHNQSWSQALTAFEKTLSLSPEDRVASLYVERCKDFIQAPPPAEWDGVFVMKTK